MNTAGANPIDSQTSETDTLESVVAKQRQIQAEQDALDQQSTAAHQPNGAPQTSDTPYPLPPLPGQHLQKPGLEAEMTLAPAFLAPHYKGSGKLQDKVAVITGGDSGIGRAVAVLFAREGADVTVLYLSEEQDAQTTRQYVEREGRRCHLLAGDVKNPAWCRQAIEQVVQTFGQLDILVNNAAFQAHADKLEDITPERLDETLRTNLYGYVYMCQAALPHLKAGACIINTGSVVGLRGSGKLLDYAASKGGIHAFTKSLASSLIERGIRVNAVAPGPVWTPLNPSDKPPSQVEQFGADTDMKRPAQPEELSPAYVFLASSACASYITGVVLPVTGSVDC